MRKWIFAAALIAATFSAQAVRADSGVFPPLPPSKGPMTNTHPNPVFSGFFAHFRGGNVLPVFQAAPWYLYWPYDAHFLTPAPMQGAFYAPPIYGNYSAQPYFPSPQPQWVAPAGTPPVFGN
jgi:hypothetical protein